MPAAYFKLLGRFGNLMFQYSFARAWCEQNGYDLCLDPWIGEKVFQIPEAIRAKWEPDKSFGEAYCQDQASLIYTRKQVKEWFKFKPEIEERLQPAKCNVDVILNLRQGEDYKGAGLVRVSSESYLDAYERLIQNPRKLVRDYETDIYPTKLFGFKGDVWASGQGVTMVALPSFYRLMTAPILFRANSSFSWWAATLADNQRVYAPIIKGLPSGDPVYCYNFVEGNWPQMTTAPINTDLHLKEA